MFFFFVDFKVEFIYFIMNCVVWYLLVGIVFFLCCVFDDDCLVIKVYLELLVFVIMFCDLGVEFSVIMYGI